MKTSAQSAKARIFDELGSLLLGAFVGFLIIAFAGAVLPIIAHLIGGFFAGLIAGRGMAKGALAGLIAGVLGGFIATILLIGGLMSLSGVLGKLIEGFMTEALGIAIGIVAILLNVFGAIVAVAGGLLGGLVRAIYETF